MKLLIPVLLSLALHGCITDWEKSLPPITTSGVGNFAALLGGLAKPDDSTTNLELLATNWELEETFVFKLHAIPGLGVYPLSGLSIASYSRSGKGYSGVDGSVTLLRADSLVIAGTFAFKAVNGSDTIRFTERRFDL